MVHARRSERSRLPSAGNPKPGEAIYEYQNSQEAGTLWFHDHTLGTTRINVYAGLAGFYFLEDPQADDFLRLRRPSHTPPDGSEAYPSTIKEFVNNTDWNGFGSPSIAHDFPGDGISELPRVGSLEEWQILYLSDMQGGHPLHLHLTQFQVLNRETLTTDALAKYMNDWNYAFGTNKWVPLPAGCSKHTFCPDYGPPLDYKNLNDDGALGGNIAFSGYTDPKNIMPPNVEKRDGRIPRM